MKILRQLNVIYMLMKMKLSRNMAFRFSFFGAFFADCTLFLMQLLMFSAIYSQVGSIGNWDRSQMILFIGTFSIVNALSMTIFFFGLITIPEKIKSGDLDLYITKPVSSLFYLSFESMDLGSFPLVFASIALILYAATGMSVPISFLSVAGYIFLVILMTVLWYDLMVIVRTIPFFIIQANFIETLEGEVLTLCTKIPGTLFKGPFKILFNLLLPYGLMATVPAQFFSGTLSGTGFLYSVVLVSVFHILTLQFWKFGLKHYKSASS